MTALDQFADVVGPSACLTEPNDLEPYSLDWRGNFHARPAAVVKPASTDEVARVLAVARAADLAVVPAGGRTGLCGGAVALANGPASIVLSLERLNRIRDVDAQDF